MLSAARAADMVLIPCRPSAADLTAIGASIELARQGGVPTHAIFIVARNRFVRPDFRVRGRVSHYSRSVSARAQSPERNPSQLR